MYRMTVAVIALGALVGLMGCAGSGSGAALDTPGTAEKPLPHPATLALFDGRTGERASWIGLIDDAASADVVVIGEQHGHRVGLHAAAELFAAILERAPDAALSMEFFERDEQTHIDDFLTGVTDDEAFRKAAGRNKGNYPPGHAAMVEAAKAAGAPVYASNAPRRYVRLARTDGYERIEGLTAEQRRLVVLPASLTEGRYRDTFFELMSGMGGHGGDDDEAEMTEEERAEQERRMQAMVESFFRSQNVWDATMADTVVHALNDGDRPVVHVVGQFHSDFEGGLVERIRTAAPGARIVTFSMESVWSDAFREEDAERADYVMYVGGSSR